MNSQKIRCQSNVIYCKVESERTSEKNHEISSFESDGTVSKSGIIFRSDYKKLAEDVLEFMYLKLSPENKSLKEENEWLKNENNQLKKSLEWTEKNF